ncbi:hypothetical protein DFS34DRAFT_631924 [Phlyctochytrium arcticum]|nr:hypothetical protein DFS34DRAFT_631924 [Phlyctochytrium arcticum]
MVASKFYFSLALISAVSGLSTLNRRDVEIPGAYGAVVQVAPNVADSTEIKYPNGFEVKVRTAAPLGVTVTTGPPTQGTIPPGFVLASPNAFKLVYTDPAVASRMVKGELKYVVDAALLSRAQNNVNNVRFASLQGGNWVIEEQFTFDDDPIVPGEVIETEYDGGPTMRGNSEWIVLVRGTAAPPPVATPSTPTPGAPTTGGTIPTIAVPPPAGPTNTPPTGTNGNPGTPTANGGNAVTPIGVDRGNSALSNTGSQLALLVAAGVMSLFVIA